MHKKTWIAIGFVADLLVLAFTAYLGIKENSTYALIVAAVALLGGVKLVVEFCKPDETIVALRTVIAQELDKRWEQAGGLSYENGIPQSNNLNLLTLFLEALRHRRKLQYEKAIKALMAALALRGVPLAAAAALHSQIAVCYYLQSKLDQSLGSGKQGLSLARKAQDIAGEVIALTNMGLVSQEKGDLANACKWLDEALAKSEKAGLLALRPMILSNKAIALYQTGNLDDAQTASEQSLRSAEATGDKQLQAIQLNTVGLIHDEKGRPDEALKSHRDGLEIARSLGYKLLQAMHLGNIGILLKHERKLDEALEHHRESLRIYKEIGFRRGEAEQLGSIGKVYRAKGDLTSALKYYEEAEIICDDIGYAKGKATVLFSIAVVHFVKGELKQASKYMATAVELLNSIGMSWKVDQLKRKVEAFLQERVEIKNE